MPNLNNLTTQDLQWGTANWSGQGYIDGLKMVWNSATSISVTSGAAFIPSLSKCLPSTTMLTLSGLVLTASTWYHLYLYLNAGAPAVECVATAPAAPYYGTARTKTGDTSRRYLGSVLADASGNIYNFTHRTSDGFVQYQTNIGTSPFVVVNGQATTPTNVSCAAMVPITCSFAKLFVANNDTVKTVYLGNANYPPTSTTFIAYVASPGVYSIDFALDSSLSFQYLYNGTPTANFVARVAGYNYER